MGRCCHGPAPIELRRLVLIVAIVSGHRSSQKYSCRERKADKVLGPTSVISQFGKGSLCKRAREKRWKGTKPSREEGGRVSQAAPARGSSTADRVFHDAGSERHNLDHFVHPGADASRHAVSENPIRVVITARQETDLPLLDENDGAPERPERQPVRRLADSCDNSTRQVRRAQMTVHTRPSAHGGLCRKRSAGSSSARAATGR